MRGTLIEAHIADIHFGAMDPQVQLNILRDQFLSKIAMIPTLDIVSINGDYFDKKYMANSNVIICANQFMFELVNLCRQRNTSIILIHGTESHDAHQLGLYYQYVEDPTIDFYIIETAQFITVKGKTILCIPEENNRGSEYYNIMFSYREYDACYLHGTFVGSIYGANKPDLSARRPVFGIKDFWRCTGPIICGHVHLALCLEKHVYYCGSPMRWAFGEEQPKGFLILCHNLDTREYYIHMEEIISFQYVTVDVDALMMSDPRAIINYLEDMKAHGVDYVKLKIKSNDYLPIIKDYFHASDWVSYDVVKTTLSVDEEAMQSKYQGLDFLTDPSIDEFTKFVMYVNSQEGEGFITVEKLKQILKEEIR